MQLDKNILNRHKISNISVSIDHCKHISEVIYTPSHFIGWKVRPSRISQSETRQATNVDLISYEYTRYL